MTTIDKTALFLPTSSQDKKLAYDMGRHFLAFTQNHTPATAKNYASEVLRFFEYVKNYHPIEKPSDLTRSHIIFYQAELKKQGYAHQTIARKLSAISSFCSYLAHEGLIERDLSYGVKRPKVRNKKETADLSDADVRLLFERMRRDRSCYVHHIALLAVGFYTGLRSSEIRHLKIKDYAKLDGHMILTCVIKGDKYHEVPLNPFVVRCLDEHIAKLKELGFKVEEPEHYLFPSIQKRLNKPIQSRSFWEIFQARLKDAGLELSNARRYSPHTMRATLAGHLLNTVGGASRTSAKNSRT